MTVKFMPFWCLDLKRTEEKLSAYAEKGLFPVDFKAYGRFILEERKPESVKFRIVRTLGCNGNVPRGISEKGWVKDAGGKNYYIVHMDKNSDVQMPSYKGHINFYRAVQVVCFFIICFFVGFGFGLFAHALDEEGVPITDALAGYIPSIIVMVLVTAFLFRIRYSNKKLLAESENSVKIDFTIPEENFIYTKEQEKAMLKSGEMMKKTPLAWISAPDRAEEMVEKLALEGWKFYRLDKMGTTFYFVKSEPCNLKFCVDYQKEISDDYINLTKDEGWKLEFLSVTRVEGYCIWSKEYGEDEEIPQLYSDSESALAHAKKYFFSMVLPMILMVLLYVYIVLDILVISKEDFGGVGSAVMLGFGAVVIIEYGYFAVRSLGYILRLKKKNAGSSC
ncbi:MAG: DUF2812 domain-containing protein [Oscillospiraceae bacterium]|nr:DUF2812 domain-containing protein [Oscillospiraceae bacterium]